MNAGILKYQTVNDMYAKTVFLLLQGETIQIFIEPRTNRGLRHSLATAILMYDMLSNAV